MRAMANVLAAAACAVVLCMAVAGNKTLKKPLLGASMLHRRPQVQMYIYLQQTEKTPEPLQTTQTPQNQSLSDSETELCEEEGATHHEAVKRSSLVRDQKPQRMVRQLPAQMRFSETQPSSELSSQMHEDSPPQPETHSQLPENTAQLLQVTQNQSMPGSQTTLSTAVAAVDRKVVNKPLLVKDPTSQAMQRQLPGASLPFGITLESLPPTPPTPENVSLPNSGTASPAEGVTTQHQIVKHSLLTQYQKPQSMLRQLPSQVRFFETQPFSQLSFQIHEDSPPQPEANSPSLTNRAQRLQVTSSKPQAPQNQSMVDLRIVLYTPASATDPKGGKKSLLRRPLVHQHEAMQMESGMTPEVLRMTQMWQTQPLPEPQSALCEEDVAADSKGVNQPLHGRAQDAQHTSNQMPTLSQPREVTSEPVQVISSTPITPQTQSQPDSKTTFSTTAAAVDQGRVKQSLLVNNQKPQRMLGQVPLGGSLLRSTFYPIRVTLPKPPTAQIPSFPPYLQAFPQPTLQEPSPSSQQSSHSPPVLTNQLLQTESTLPSPQSPQIPPKSSTQTTSQSSIETHPSQLTPSTLLPLPRTPDSGKKCNCFHELPQRRWLDCSNRSLNAIREDDLCDAIPTYVNLSHNSFVSLPENLGESVKSLNLSHNLLTTIPRSLPLHPSMHTLDLSFNRITNSSDELEDMSNLKWLYVQRNRLQSLNFLPKACSLYTLVAHHNQLRSLDYPLINCFMIRELDLSWNHLSELSKNVIGNFFFLHRLHLVHSGLTSIPPGVFGRSVYLKFVDLSENKLTTLPSRAFDEWLIETILLDKNIISSLPNDTFSKRHPYSIIKISLAQNKLKTIPRGLFAELKSLEHLNLNYNYLRHLPTGVFDGLNLTEIGLQTNLLEDLPPRLFSGLKNLKRINLGGNQLASVPGDLLADLSNLELLDLSENLLTTVPAGLFNGVKSIKVLDLSLNLLSTLSGCQLEGLNHVEWLYLKGNQLKELPVFDAKWPQVMNFNLEKNHIEELSEIAVRSWLGDGSQERRVTLGGRQWLRSVGSLRWVVDDPRVTAIVDVADCRCGFVNRGRAHLFFCASVSCPADAANWVDEASRTVKKQTAP